MYSDLNYEAERMKYERSGSQNETLAVYKMQTAKPTNKPDVTL